MDRSVARRIKRYRFQLWDVAVIVVIASFSMGVFGIALTLFFVALFVFVASRRLRALGREIRKRAQAEQQAVTLARQDPLTGLSNRRHFDEAVAAAVASPPGARRVHAVLMLDLNRFKSINDTYGHPIGDKVLSVVAARLGAAVRQGDDVVARVGGDEFAVVATQVYGVEEASSIGLRIIDALRDPIEVDGNEHSVGIGIGIALFPQDAQDSGELVRRADIALYRAKDEHGSAIKFFQEEMDEQVKARARLERELRRAVARRELVVHYQPQVDLATGELTGFEALARWHHRELGDIPPDRFIPIAEECGLINELGAQLLSRACHDAATWHGEATVSVNISPVQLHMPDFGAMVETVLLESGLAPYRLELEITENTLVRDLHAAQQALSGLRAAGVRLALDDFGTGYSSLYHLRNFRVDRIKIDRSFVQSMATEHESGAIVCALLGLGHGLGIKVTAEGVEDAAQRERLKGNGCDEAQGFLFSDALSPADAWALCEPTLAVADEPPA
jgi:diguanylate cyclase (GGDEF)-like protein